jgi:hypothetical protein
MEVKYTLCGRTVGKYKANGKDVDNYLGGRKLIYKKSWYSHQVPKKDCKFLHSLFKRIHPKLGHWLEEPYYMSEYVVFYNPYKSVIDSSIRSKAYGKKNTPFSNVWLIVAGNPENIAQIISKSIIMDPKTTKMLNQESESFIIDEAPF